MRSSSSLPFFLFIAQINSGRALLRPLSLKPEMVNFSDSLD